MTDDVLLYVAAPVCHRGVKAPRGVHFTLNMKRCRTECRKCSSVKNQARIKNNEGFNQNVSLRDGIVEPEAV